MPEKKPQPSKKKPATRPTSTRSKPAPEAQPVESPIPSRVEEFRALAQRYANGGCVMRPGQLRGYERRMHVRDTIIEDHASRIDQKAQGASEKFDKLSRSLYPFFRGTSLLFHRDMAGEDPHMPTVLLLGDVHPLNFGIMPNADNVPIFGVNDFDDVSYGPFTWDLKRGATGFLIAVEEEGGLGVKQQHKIAAKFIEGYIDGTEQFARDGTESRDGFRPDNAPKVIRRLFVKEGERRKTWLWKRYLNETGRGFRANEEFTPISSRVDEFQKQIDSLARRDKVQRSNRIDRIKVKDVAIRHGQGTASLGLPRYYVLLEGPSNDASDDLIIEFKRARPSVLDGLVPENDFDAGERGERIAHGQAVHLASGDVFYGAVEIDGMSFMSRERAPFRGDMDLDDLSKSDWKKYADVCGRALAQAHARSDDAGQIDYDVEPRIVEAIGPKKLFVDDILGFAEEARDRMRLDHASFRRDHKRGAFRDLTKSYR